MKKRNWCLVVGLSAVLSATVAWSAGDTSANVERGKYLVENVAMCADCHSARNERGEFDRSTWLQGSTLEFKPLHPMPWADVAPPIAGLPGWTDDEAVKLLQTARTPKGEPLKPPMPPYKMSKEDATAVVAYLRSLE